MVYFSYIYFFKVDKKQKSPASQIRAANKLSLKARTRFYVSEIGLISGCFIFRQTALLRRKCVRKKKSPRRLSHHSECCNILWRCEKVVRVKYGHVSIRKASANAPCCPFAHRGKIVDFKRFSTRGDSQFWLYFFKLKGCSTHTVSNSVNGPLISNLYPCISPPPDHIHWFY